MVLRGHKNWVTDAVYSVNGPYSVTTSADGTALLHRAALRDVLVQARAQVPRPRTPEERALFLGEPRPPTPPRIGRAKVRWRVPRVSPRVAALDEACSPTHSPNRSHRRRPGRPALGEIHRRRGIGLVSASA